MSTIRIVDQRKSVEVVALVDLNHFNHASRYYRSEDERRSWLNLPGILDVARKEIACRLDVSTLCTKYVSAKAYIGSLGLRVQEGRLYTALPTGYFDALRRAGIEPEIANMVCNRESDVDERLQRDLVYHALLGRHIVLVSGDSDHIAAVRLAREQGALVAHVGWNLPGANGGVGVGCSRALRKVCDPCLEMEGLIGGVSPQEDPAIREMFVTTARRAWQPVYHLHRNCRLIS